MRHYTIPIGYSSALKAIYHQQILLLKWNYCVPISQPLGINKSIWIQSIFSHSLFSFSFSQSWEHAVPQLVRTLPIPDGVIGIFHWRNPSRETCHSSRNVAISHTGSTICWGTFLQSEPFLHSEIFLAYTTSEPSSLVMLKTHFFFGRVQQF